jgi:hypothetical protein
VPRVTLYHLTAPQHLPLIEEEGLRTRADLSGTYGPPEDFDLAAPGTYAHGKRVSGYLALDYARTRVEEHGAGLVSYSVDPAKTLAARAADRQGADPKAYWESARPLAAWQADGDVPDDLEVHVNVPVRGKYLTLHAPLFSDADLGDYAPLVAAVADTDRLSAKALMHLAVIASEGEFDSDDFRAACALAWRDTPDPEGLTRELVELDPDKIASAALAEFGGDAHEATHRLREALESTREWAEENGLTPARGILTRTALVLEQLPSA